MPISWEVGVAIYAAVVGTGALFLEVRRWFESRPRLVVSVAPGMATFNIPETEDNTYVIVTVANRGAFATTVTHLGLLGYPSWWRRLWRKHTRATFVNCTIPGSIPLPHMLGPGAKWEGMILENDDLRDWAESDRVYVVIYASHSDRGALLRLKLKPEGEQPLEGAEEMGSD